jgi:hypothetical protein
MAKCDITAWLYRAFTGLKRNFWRRFLSQVSWLNSFRTDQTAAPSTGDPVNASTCDNDTCSSSSSSTSSSSSSYAADSFQKLRGVLAALYGSLVILGALAREAGVQDSLVRSRATTFLRDYQVFARQYNTALTAAMQEQAIDMGPATSPLSNAEVCVGLWRSIEDMLDVLKKVSHLGCGSPRCTPGAYCPLSYHQHTSAGPECMNAPVRLQCRNANLGVCMFLTMTNTYARGPLASLLAYLAQVAAGAAVEWPTDPMAGVGCDVSVGMAQEL